MDDIDISGIDRRILLDELHQGTRALGMGMLHDKRRLSDEDLNVYLDEDRARDGALHFDYVCGRPVKVTFDNDTLEGAALYDRDAGDGACAAAVARAKERSK